MVSNAVFRPVIFRRSRRSVLIKVNNLSKYYGFTRAVRDLSFEVQKGEVLGLLGPNGAGKSTVIKILAGYLPPSSGSATVFGFDILKDSMEVRKRIGYLPEKTPLYHDMRVNEYLGFVAGLKDVRTGRIRASVDGALTRCGLENVCRKTIGTLSKGYQQRVGIAQAIINEPDLLILDEPTLGLDPRQIIEIRQLINSLGAERTVILSSHILPEVNQVCNRIVIIDKGRLVAVDSPENLRERLRKSSMTRVTVRSSTNHSRVKDIISRIDGVLMVNNYISDDDVTSLVVESAPHLDVREKITLRLAENGIGLLEIFNEELSLEDIFIKLVTEETN